MDQTQDPRTWSTEQVRHWIEAQTGPRYWYQTIPVRDGIVTPGRYDSRCRLDQLGLPADLAGKSVLDVGCNSGMLCFEAKRRNAARVLGIEPDSMRVEQARMLAAIMGLDIEFIEGTLASTNEYGLFDIVFCIAVVTEIENLIGSLLRLKEVTGETLYLELATTRSFPKTRRFLGLNINSLLDLNLNSVIRCIWPRWDHGVVAGSAKLRRINTRKMQGWSLVPNREFLDSIFSDEFTITPLGRSVRYELFRLSRRAISAT